MSSYKIIFRDENPAWQLDCPLQVEVIQVVRETESQRAFLQLKARNVSNETLGAAEVTAYVTAPDRTVETIAIGSLDADISPGSTWKPHARELATLEIAGVNTYVTRAGNARLFGQAMTLPAPEELNLSPGAERARYFEIKKAGLDPNRLRHLLLEGKDWWRCSCGALNFDRVVCHSCSAQKELIVRLEDLAWLEERDQELRYQGAAEALASGRIRQMEWSQSEFEGLGDYRDSAEQAKECAKAISKAKTTKRRTLIATAALIAVVAITAGAINLYKPIAEERRLQEAFEQYTIPTFSREMLSAGAGHTVGLSLNGTVVATGNNDDSQCDVSDWEDIVAVSAGDLHSVGLHPDGTVVTTGSNEYGQCDVDAWTYIVSISAGYVNTVGLRPDGTVLVAGDNSCGQCDVEGWEDITEVSSGPLYTLGLRSDGTVIATGDNTYGQCDVSEWTDIVAISAGRLHSVGLRSDGTVVATGYSADGCCSVGDWTDVVAVSAGGRHTIGLRSDGTVLVAGFNSYHRELVSEWSDVVAVSAGVEHTVGLRSDGTVIAEGKNDNGQCDVTEWEGILVPQG